MERYRSRSALAHQGYEVDIDWFIEILRGENNFVTRKRQGKMFSYKVYCSGALVMKQFSWGKLSEKSSRECKMGAAPIHFELVRNIN